MDITVPLDGLPYAVARMGDVAPTPLAVWFIFVALLIVGVLATACPYR